LAYVRRVVCVDVDAGTIGLAGKMLDIAHQVVLGRHQACSGGTKPMWAATCCRARRHTHDYWEDHMQRRKVIPTLGAAEGSFLRTIVLAGAVIAAPLVPGASETLKLGVLTDLNGLYADAAGQGSVETARMAVEDSKDKLVGWSIEVISADHLGKPDVGSAIARRWLDEQGVDVIVGVPNSGVALAVQQITRDKKKNFLITGGSSVDLTGKACSPYTAHWTDDTYSLSSGLIRALIQTGKTTYFFITADYAFGHSIEAEATRVIKAGGGQVLGSVRHPTLAPDFSSYLVQAQASKAEVIALANGGTDTIQAIKQAHEFGIVAAGQSLVGMGLFLTDVHSLGLEVAQGLLLSAGFYWDLNDATRVFSRRFEARIGRMPTREQAETYSAVLHYLKAVAAENSKDAMRVITRMKATPVEDFYAPGGILREDGRLLHSIYLARVKSPAESKFPWDYYKILSKLDASSAFRPLEEGGCYFVQKK
jgi:branched-chain amino acid transport system substrate-binding protein